MSPGASPALRSVSTAAAGGLLLYAAFPPIDLWFVAPLGPLLLALSVRGRPKRAAFLAGTVFGLAFFGPLIVWLANLGVAAWLALTAVQALILGLAAIPLPRLLALPGWPLFGAAWWVAVEALRGRVPLGGFPWGSSPSARPTRRMRAGPRSAARPCSPSPWHSRACSRCAV